MHLGSGGLVACRYLVLLVTCGHLCLGRVPIVQLIRVILIDQIFFFIIILVHLRSRSQVDLILPIIVLPIIHAASRILPIVKLRLLIRAIMLILIMLLVMLLEILLHLLLLLHSHLLLSLSLLLLSLKRRRILLHLLTDSSIKRDRS